MYSYGAKEQQNTFGYHLQPKFRNTNNKNCDLLDLFEEGVAKEKLHKIEMPVLKAILHICFKYCLYIANKCEFREIIFSGAAFENFPPSLKQIHFFSFLFFETAVLCIFCEKRFHFLP